MSEAAKLLDVLLKARAMRTEDYLILKAELDKYHALVTALRKSTLLKYDGDRALMIQYPHNPEWKLQQQ